ncbi:unnamed protein product [Bursaphelenchus xylophilus]|uniref:(pine wood nematode) hypothetical protein n=1 Tax=Bursaphelenchus xylophilus TaxID=6326 RepID=A0A7I8XQR8_BURXY|nr:unnamed protein product [Bursaphelenchus xylophilus]CAG9125113.1 unnamed protein product [Bursaphelenchus xylophilus]
MALKIYHDLNNPSCYTGPSTITRITGGRYEDVYKQLASDESYNLHKPLIRRFKRLKTIPRGLFTDLQADVADFRRLSRFNKGYKYCLLCVDVISRKFFACPLKQKGAMDIKEAFVKIFEEMPHPPEVVFTDNGKEFKNSTLKSYFTKEGTEIYHSGNIETKASIAERGIRTVKQRLYKYMTAHNSKRWIDALPLIIKAINQSLNRTLGMRPIDVTNENWYDLWKRLYSRLPKKEMPPLIVPGDHVRISLPPQAFKKGYTVNFTKEIFQVHQVLNSTPRTFVLKDQEGEILEGRFYLNELSLVTQ